MGAAFSLAHLTAIIPRTSHSSNEALSATANIGASCPAKDDRLPLGNALQKAGLNICHGLLIFIVFHNSAVCILNQSGQPKPIEPKSKKSRILCN